MPHTYRDGMPTIKDRSRQFARKLQWSVRYYGFDLTVLGGLVKVLSLMSKNAALSDWYKGAAARRFDKRFRVETTGFIPVAELDISDYQKEGANPYQATASVTFAVVLSELGITYEDYVFVDYGSGKGRSLVLAAHFPFKAVVGVEVSSSLHQTAENNVRQLLANGRVKCRNIKSVCEDAGTFKLASEPLVIYLFHPFKAQVLTMVLENIRQSLEQCPRHMVIIYQLPLSTSSTIYQHAQSEFKDLLDSAGFLRRARIRIDDPRWEVYETVALPNGAVEASSYQNRS